MADSALRVLACAYRENENDNNLKEDYSIIIVRSKYKEAINSVQEKLKQRSEDALDECYYFSQEYPETKHKKEIEKISAHLEKVLLQFENTED